MNFDTVCFALLGLVWGANFLMMKLAVQVISPLQVTWLRVLCGAVPIVAVACARGGVRRADLRHAPHFVFLAITSLVIPYLGFVMGSRLLPSGAAGSIAGIVPLLTAVLAALALPGDRLTTRKVVGLALGGSGVLLVARTVETFAGRSGGDEIYGLAYMLAGALGYAVAVVYQRRFVTPLRIGALSLASYQTAIAAVVLTALVPKDGLGALLARPELFGLTTLGLGALGTGVAFLMYYHVIEKFGAVGASSVFYLPPVSALLMGAIFASERISWSQGAGAALILLGIYASRSRDGIVNARGLGLRGQESPG